MPKSKRTLTQEGNKALADAVSLIRHLRMGIVDHHDRMVTIIRNRIDSATSDKPLYKRQLTDQMNALEVVQALSEVMNILRVIASRTPKDFKNSDIRHAALDWLRQLDILETTIGGLPTSGKLERDVDFILSKAVRSHIIAIRRLMPGVADAVKKIIVNDVVGRHHENSTDLPVIPAQVHAPIMTTVVDDKLTVAAGELIYTSEQQTEITNYLASQLERFLMELASSNIDRRNLEIFSETKEIFGGWSTSKVLAFGAHLYLLENVAVTIMGEIAAPLASRITGFLANSQNFVNSFEEWRSYSDESSAFYLTFEDKIDDIKIDLQRVNEALSSEEDVVEARIPSSLDNFAELAAKPQIKNRALGFASALRSVKNVAISLVDYAINKAEAGLEFIAGSRVLRLLRVFCRIISPLLNLAKTLPSFSWVLA